MVRVNFTEVLEIIEIKGVVSLSKPEKVNEEIIAKDVQIQ